MRRSALSGLGNLKASEADAALIDLFEQSTDEAFKEEVIRRLGYSESRTALDKLQAIATRETSARLRKAAVRQLTRTASNASVFDGDFEWRQE
jgi:HEAT repeat protein